MERSEVYKRIDGERDYQDEILKNPHRTIDEFILYIKANADTLAKGTITFANKDEKLSIIRKIAGLCVHCGERHGMPKRRN
ncbi:MAG: hypothetical protein ACXAAH_01565 [Promethearchaeota archaeon]|jgi:hypothetical protein